MRLRALFLLLACLPVLASIWLSTQNPSIDAWYYAACSRWGQELAQPHHLFYNGIGWAWLTALGATAARPAADSAMQYLQLLNALAAGGCLWVLAPLLRWAGARREAVPVWLLVVGSTFGMLRFATENEAYVQPLLLALLASLVWVQALRSQGGRRGGWLLLAGGLAVLACLIHQLMVWWALGLVLGLRPWQSRRALAHAALFAAPAVLVPVAYILAAPGGAAGVPEFIMHDYLTGGAKSEWGWQSLLLTFISLIRTLVQVHGNMLALVQRWPVALGLVGAGCTALGLYALWDWRWTSATGSGPEPGLARRIRRTHLLISGLHLGFALQATGNAEFMVMLPSLAAVVLAGGGLVAWPTRRVAALGLALLGWNLAFGLLPAHFLDYSGSGAAWRAWVLARPKAWVLLDDPNLLRNQLQYYTGRAGAVPRVQGLQGPEPQRFRAWLRERLMAGEAVYTDGLGSARPFDRARLVQGGPAPDWLAGLRTVRVDSLPTFFGPRYITRIYLPAVPPAGAPAQE